uniref:Secreted protein n=1 Tax=Arundo donax TaxID=35708 RepID=A0A0A9GVT7_ARUDO
MCFSTALTAAVMVSKGLSPAWIYTMCAPCSVCTALSPLSMQISSSSRSFPCSAARNCPSSSGSITTYTGSPSSPSPAAAAGGTSMSMN